MWNPKYTQSSRSGNIIVTGTTMISHYLTPNPLPEKTPHYVALVPGRTTGS